MEIKNEEHAREMVDQWRKLPLPARKRELRLAIEQLELGAMYYEQKGNDKGMQRMRRCIRILSEHFESLE